MRLQTIPRLFQLLLAFLSLTCPAMAAATYKLVGLECDRAKNPLGVDVSQPQLSWRISSDAQGAKQNGWQILVASSEVLLAEDKGDLWDSGKISNDRTTSISYSGAPLKSSQQVFWKVRNWAWAGDTPSGWSTAATWTMGLLSPDDWKAQWITLEKPSQNLLVRREFVVKPGLRRAIAHVTGLGQYELFLNGEKHGNDILSPGWTDYRKTVLYDTRDVTKLLREGQNAIGMSLGNGMFHVVRAEGRFAKFVGSYGAQRALLQMRLEYADGSVDTVITDPSWKAHSGPISFSSIYGGEDYDARLVQAGWKRSGFDDSSWKAAKAYTGKSGTLKGHSRAAEPVAEIEKREVKERKQLAKDKVLFDFGQNVSFIPRLRMSGPAGSAIKLTGGELVKEDGTINRATMGGAHRGSAWWQYTKATDEEESWFPQFYYLGSRYLYVELIPAEQGGDLPNVEAVEMAVVHSTAKNTGVFRCSDPTLNRIRDMVRWAQRSNMVSVLTDCPHREKLGWLEQNHLNGPALRYEWDLDRLAVKNVADMAEAQIESGLIPNVAPEYKVFKGTYRAAAEWGASFIMVPWQHYLFTGDDSLLRENFAAMVDYFDYLEKRANGGLLDEGLGDWYDVVKEKPGRAHLTHPSITATAHFYQNAVVLSQAAEIIGLPREAKTFAAKAEKIRKIYNKELYKPDTEKTYGSGSQASLAIPLDMGIVEEANRDLVADSLVKNIRDTGYFNTGAVGTRYLFRTLADHGHSDLIHEIITNPEIPGYAYQLKQGNTSLPESWTSLTGASQNHFFLGQIVEWFYRDVAGIRFDESKPGFEHIAIRPVEMKSLEWAEASYDSIRGQIQVRWDRKDSSYKLTVTIPANTTATVTLPVPTSAKVTDSSGTRRVPDKKENPSFEVDSGNHVFEARW